MRAAAFVIAFALMLGGAIAAEPSVTARDGNIFFVDSSGREKQLTSSGRDSNPVLDPQRKWIVFVRAIPGKKVESGSGESDAAELWQVRTDGKEPLMLVRTSESERMENVVAGFDDVQFSVDGRLVYFISPAWATSGAAHVVDTTTRKERFVTAANSLHVIQTGQYRDHLLVQQHRYFLGAGSYDWFYLYTPKGEEVGVVGENPDTFYELYIDEAERAARRDDE